MLTSTRYSPVPQSDLHIQYIKGFTWQINWKILEPSEVDHLESQHHPETTQLKLTLILPLPDRYDVNSLNLWLLQTRLTTETCNSPAIWFCLLFSRKTVELSSPVMFRTTSNYCSGWNCCHEVCCKFKHFCILFHDFYFHYTIVSTSVLQNSCGNNGIVKTSHL